MPVPPCIRAPLYPVELNLLKMPPSLSGDIPVPSSLTVMRAVSLFEETSTVMLFPEGVKRNALESRLNTILSSLSLSTHIMTGSSGDLNSSMMSCSSAILLKLAVIDLTSCPKSVSCRLRCMFPVSSFLMSSIWFTRRSSLFELRSTTVSDFLIPSSSTPLRKISFTLPDMRVSGVLISCDMFVKNFSLMPDIYSSILTFCFSRNIVKNMYVEPAIMIKASMM